MRYGSRRCPRNSNFRTRAGVSSIWVAVRFITSCSSLYVKESMRCEDELWGCTVLLEKTEAEREITNNSYRGMSGDAPGRPRREALSTRGYMISNIWPAWVSILTGNHRVVTINYLLLRELAQALVRNKIFSLGPWFKQKQHLHCERTCPRCGG